MTDKLKQIVNREVTKLPKEARDAINSLDWGKITEEIGKKYLLNESEINDLHAVTLTILTGLTDVELLSKSIENEVGTSKEEAGKIADEVEEEIFTPIYNTLTENIKKSMQGKTPSWRQEINFILSGGNYLVFIEEETSTSTNALKSTIQDILKN